MPEARKVKTMSLLEIYVVPLSSFRETRNTFRAVNNDPSLQPIDFTDKVIFRTLSTSLETAKTLIYGLTAYLIYNYN